MCIVNTGASGKEKAARVGTTSGAVSHSEKGYLSLINYDLSRSCGLVSARAGHDPGARYERVWETLGARGRLPSQGGRRRVGSAFPRT